MIELLNLKNDILLEENEDRFSEIDLILKSNIVEQNQILQDLILFTDKHRKYKSLSYLETLLEKLPQESLLEVFDTDHVCFNSKKLNNLRLNNLLNCGELKQFEEVLAKILTHLCTYKYHAYLLELISQYDKHIQNKDFVLLARILYLTETSNFNELFQTIKSLVSEEPTRESSQRIKKINTILSKYEFDDVNFFKVKLLAKVWSKTAGEDNRDLTAKEIITYMVLFSNEKELMYIFSSVKNKKSLFSYLNNDLKIKPFDIPKYLTSLKNFSINKVKVTPIIKEEESLIRHEEPISEVSVSQSNLDEDIIDDNSGQIVWAVKNSEMSDEQVQSMIIALIETKQFQSAMKLTSELEESSNKYYMQAEVSLKLKEFRESIYYSNKGLENKSLNADETLSFLYLKYLAYKALSNTEMEREYKRKIMMLNPTYRNININ